MIQKGVNWLLQLLLVGISWVAFLKTQVLKIQPLSLHSFDGLLDFSFPEQGRCCSWPIHCNCCIIETYEVALYRVSPLTHLVHSIVYTGWHWLSGDSDFPTQLEMPGIGFRTSCMQSTGSFPTPLYHVPKSTVCFRISQDHMI